MTQAPERIWAAHRQGKTTTILAGHASEKVEGWTEYVRADLCRASAAPTDAHPDDLAVDRFAAAMKEKLAKKRSEGRGGWEGKSCNTAFLSKLLREHVEKGDPLDVGNLAMMLHQRGESIAAPADDALRVKVKPLAWEWDTRDVGDFWSAKSPVGEYEAGRSDDGYAFACCDDPAMWEWQPDVDSRLLSVDDAKAAAQADFAARILSVIEVTPTDTHASDAAIAGLKSMGEPE